MPTDGHECCLSAVRDGHFSWHVSADWNNSLTERVVCIQCRQRNYLKNAPLRVNGWYTETSVEFSYLMIINGMSGRQADSEIDQ